MRYRMRYRITATWSPAPGVVDTNDTPEGLGAAYRRSYPSREEAEAEAECLQGTLGEYPDLHPSTTYSVVEVEE